MKFNERLKLLRYERGLTQDDLGYIFNLTKSCICCYENGTRLPSIDILIEMATYFRVSTDYLLGIELVRDDYKNKLTKKDKNFINLMKEYPVLYQKVVDNPIESILMIRKIFND